MSKTFLDADMDAELEEMEKDNELSEEDNDKEGKSNSGYFLMAVTLKNFF